MDFLTGKPRLYVLVFVFYRSLVYIQLGSLAQVQSISRSPTLFGERSIVFVLYSPNAKKSIRLRMFPVGEFAYLWLAVKSNYFRQSLHNRDFLSNNQKWLKWCSIKYSNRSRWPVNTRSENKCPPLKYVTPVSIAITSILFDDHENRSEIILNDK